MQMSTPPLTDAGQNVLSGGSESSSHFTASLGYKQVGSSFFLWEVIATQSEGRVRHVWIEIWAALLN